MTSEDLDKLTTAELLALHRELGRRVAPIYRKRNEGKWRSGVAAARDKQQRGYAAHREKMERLGLYAPAPP